MEKYYKLNTLCLFTLTFIALAVVFAMAKTILVPFTLSVFISLIYSPVISYFQNKFKLPKILVLIVSFFALILFFILISGFIGKSVESFIEGADQYKDKMYLLATQLAAFAPNLGFDIKSTDIEGLLQKFPIMDFVKKISGSMLALLSNTFLVIIFTLFILTGETQSKRNIKILEEIKTKIAKYVGTKLLTSITTGVLSYMVLGLFHVEMAFMFAVLTFLLNFIPNVGSIIATLLPVPIIYLQFSFGIEFILVCSLLAMIQVIIGNIIEPKLMGESMGLHPVTILLFLTFWGFIWGIPGMFLSVPITATLKIIFNRFDLTRPIACLLTGDLSKIKL